MPSMQRKTALCVALLALLAATMTGAQQVNWDRANDPFMRMAKKIDLVETASQLNAKAEVKHATRLLARQVPVAESSAAAESSASLAAAVDSLKSELSESAAAASSPVSSVAAPAPSVSAPVLQPASASVDASRAELLRLQSDAEEAARKMMEAATQKAQQIIAAAKARVMPKECDDGCDPDGPHNQKKVEWRDVVILKPQDSATDDINDQALGLAPVMNVDTTELIHAIKIGTAADSKHQTFIDQHEIDCKGPICPLAKN